jgi:hypothetical protein
LSAFDFFDRVYCIHLPNEQRRKHMDAQLASVGLSATYVCADAPPKGFTVPNMRRNPRAEFGANLGHISAIVEAIADGAKRPLFLEDDVTFKRVEVGPLVEKWDLLYLGGHPREPAHLVSPGLARVKTFSCAEAYSIRGELLRDFHHFWCSRISKPNAMYDFILGEFAAKHDSYAFYPTITEQAPFVSHIKGEIDDKRELVERGWQNNLSTK